MIADEECPRCRDGLPCIGRRIRVQPSAAPTKVEQGLTEEQHRLILEHDGKAIAAAKVFARRNAALSLTFDDFVGAARLGLVKAAKAFDPTRGTKFNTLAFRSMHWHCMRVLRDERRVNGWSYNRTKAEGRDDAPGMIQLARRISLMQSDKDGEDIERDDIFGITHQDHDGLWGASADVRRWRAEVLSSVQGKRNRQILEGLLAGDTYRTIGDRLGISYTRVWQLAVPLLDRLARRFGGVNPLRAFKATR